MQIYTEPVEGIKASYNKKNMVHELADRCGFTPPPDRENWGCLPSHATEAILETLGRTPADDHQDQLEQIGDHCGFSIAHRCFTADELWSILQTVKGDT